MGRSRTTARARAVAGMAVLALVAAAGPLAATAAQGSTAATAVRSGTAATAASWGVQPGVEQVTVTGAHPSQPLTLYRDGHKRLTYRADAFGQANFAYLPAKHTVLQAGPDAEIPEVRGGGVVEPGRYVIRDDSAHPPLTTASFRVLGRDDVPDQSLYARQHFDGARLDVLGKVLPGSSLEDGFHYLEMRDGVTLSAMVRFPDPSLYGNGPYPTVIEYSGYSPSNPASEEPGVQLARAFGYATVAVNMRGSACAGGVFDVFNPAQQADGYDIVETVARQPWVLHNHVGMVGLSYSGISQLYVASTRPPHLAAVLPQSVIADPYLEQWPGGIYNSGFAKQWLAERDRAASPGGSSWVAERIARGDTTCAANQRAHNLNPNFEKFGRAIEFYPETLEARDLRRLVRDINVPVYLTGAFQDEQTGAQFNTMVDNFDHAPVLRVALWNGRHPDGYAPSNVNRWFEFLEFYVAERVPTLNPVIRAAAAPILASSLQPARHRARARSLALLVRHRLPGRAARLRGRAAGARDLRERHRRQRAGRAGRHLRAEVRHVAAAEPGGRPAHVVLRARGAAERRPVGRSKGASKQNGIDAFQFDPAAGDKTIFENKPYGLLDRLWDFRLDPVRRGQAALLPDRSAARRPRRRRPGLRRPLRRERRHRGRRAGVDLGGAARRHRVPRAERVAPARPPQDRREPHQRVGDRSLVRGGRLRAAGAGEVHARQDRDPRVRPRLPRRLPAPVDGGHARPQPRDLGVRAPDYHGAIPTHRVARTHDMASALVLPVIPDYHVGPRRLPPCPSLRGMPCRAFVPVHNQPG